MKNKYKWINMGKSVKRRLSLYLLSHQHLHLEDTISYAEAIEIVKEKHDLEAECPDCTDQPGNQDL